MGGLASTFFDVMARGGVTMWPLLGLSVVSVSLILERALFWWRTNGRAGRSEVARLADALRRGDRAAVQAISAARGSTYGTFADALSSHGYSDAVAIEAIEARRPEIDRFMVILSTVITAAPMLGILGTVLGIIQSFELLGGENILTDPKEVSAGIAEALITTASGLSVALLTLFPFMAFKAQSDRALGRMEALSAAAAQGSGVKSAG